jgi:SAM-dependent methyltransferase
VADGDQISADVPLSHLPQREKAKRAGSFGGVATHYERFRPGPPSAAVDWLLAEAAHRIVDLGAGTGALSRLLVDRGEEVVAVEPDDRMRTVLVEEVPAVEAVDGRGESIPLPDGAADAVLASSSWHWMDLVPTLHEVARVLVPGGTLGVVWSGPDPEGPFVIQARALMAGQRGGSDTEESGPSALSGNEFAGLIMGDVDRPASILEIPAGVPFEQPERRVFTWDVALTADDLIGLLGTFSWIITMPEQTRAGVLGEARRLLHELLGVVGDVTVDVAFRAEAWRTHRHG